MKSKISECINLLQEHFSELYSKDTSMRCSLHSIEFFKMIKAKKYQECLDYFSKNLTKH